MLEMKNSSKKIEKDEANEKQSLIVSQTPKNSDRKELYYVIGGAVYCSIPFLSIIDLDPLLCRVI